jgi:NAD dependent epimerase/dehydratase family enzyme
VARAWEKALDDAPTPYTRKVKLRAAVVLSAAPGGIFALLRRHVLLGFGRFGDGRQMMSWIHENDFVRAIEWLIDDEDVAGVVNVAAPNPVTNGEFVDVLRRAMGRRLAIPSSGWILRFGAWLMRTEPELVLKSRNVVPGRLLERGFSFQFPRWQEAARDLAGRAGVATGRVW